jgi:signal transduction histidine kinase
MLPENQTPTACPQQLFFCYNRQQNDILYSSTTLDAFFGSTVRHLHESPLFLHENWSTVLQLRPGEEAGFSFRYENNQYHCSAKLLETPVGTAFATLLMVVVSKISRPGNTLTRDQLEEFLHLATHDLDAPLRKINLMTERLAAKIKPGEDGAEIISRISANLKDMRAMIDGVAKLAEPYDADERTTVDLNTMINQLLAITRSDHPEKTITTELDALPLLSGNAEAYRELFYNIIENAVIFSADDAVFISIRSADVKEEEKQALQLENGIKFYKITVHDKGIGFSQQDAEKIFQPFTRLHGKSAYPGSGLGLAICKKIVENHHGLIHAETTENEGARFILFLPQSLN